MQLRLEKAESVPKRGSLDIIKGLENVFLALYHLPPPISIQQVYHSTGRLTLLKSGLPYIQPGLRLNQEEFKALWKQAQPKAKDTLAFMWAIGEVALPLDAMEVVTANPSFYISKYCVRAMDQIANHHRKYYTNPHFKTELPTLPSYGEKEITTVHNSIAKSRE